MNNASDVKDTNISAVLKAIHSKKAVSRGNIAAELGLTTVTVNKLVAELSERGICEETGEFVSYGGRKAALYRINPQYGVIFGAMLTRSGIYFTVYDFAQQKIEAYNSDTSLDDVNRALSAICGKFNEWKEKYSSKNIIGAGVCIPGRASASGMVIDMPDYPQWNSLDLKERIKDACGIDISVDNDANAIAIAAKWCGFAGNMENFVYLKLDEGLGAGVMVNGTVFSGSSNCGCELGHVTINVDGERCKCGRRGCAQAYLSHSAVTDAVKNAIGRDIDENGIIELYNSGDARVRDVIGRFAEYLGILLDNTFFIFDTEAIILQNVFVRKLPDLAMKLRGNVFENDRGEIIRSFRRRPPVYIMNDDHVIDAAASTIIYEKIMSCQY